MKSVTKGFLRGAAVLVLGAIVIGAVGVHSAGAVVDQLNNGTFEQAGATAQTAFDWQNFNDGYSRVSTAHTGAWGIRLTENSTTRLAGAYQRIDFQQTQLKPVQLTVYIKGQGISQPAGAYLGATLYAEIHLTNGAVVYWNSVGNFGTFDWRKSGFNTGTLATVNAPIDYIFVIPLLAQSTGTAYFDDLNVQEFQPTQGAVTLMFDDGYTTDSTVAFPALQAKGFKGSSAIITDQIGDSGYMTLAQIKGLVSKGGWEIVSHTVDHEDLTLMNPSQLGVELKISKQILEQDGFTVKNLALPYGAYNGLVMGEAQKYYGSVRAFEQGSNVQGTYAYDVKIRGVLSTTTLADVQGWIAEAKVQKKWLVLVFHELRANGKDEYHTAPAMFNQMVQAVSASQLPVVTYDQGLTMFGAQ